VLRHYFILKRLDNNANAEWLYTVSRSDVVIKK